MAENQETATLHQRIANLQATLATVRTVDANGDHRLTSEEFANAFVQAYVADQKRMNPNNPDPLKTLREDIAAAQEADSPRSPLVIDDTGRDVNRARTYDKVMQDLSGALDKLGVPPTPEAIRTLLRNSVADGVADAQGMATRNDARSSDDAAAQALRQQQQASKDALLKQMPESVRNNPDVLAALDKTFGAAAPRSAAVPEQNPQLQKTIVDLRAQLAGYKQENIEAAPTLQQLSVAVNNASNGRGGH